VNNIILPALVIIFLLLRQLLRIVFCNGDASSMHPIAFRIELFKWSISSGNSLSEMGGGILPNKLNSLNSEIIL
jgi:hypothetical protein